MEETLYLCQDGMEGRQGGASWTVAVQEAPQEEESQLLSG